MNFKVQKTCVMFCIFISTINIFASDAGKHFILTLPKYKDANQYDEWLEKTKPSGVMLQEYHMQDRVKAKLLCTGLQSKAKDLGIYPLLICVDYEGGIVSRGADVNGFISVPSPYKLAGVGKHECFLGGKLIGQQLQDTGIVVNFAPSVDLFDEGNYILATRCFASDPNTVADCAISFVHGHNKAGVLPVIKHFPGLRLGKWDTHTSSVVKIDLSAQDFENSVLHSSEFWNKICQLLLW
jgi:beta-glucosidase-like glycosyl hydrolase